jgi:isoleucyl-tRNA synthetase
MLALFTDKYNKIRNTVKYLMSNLYDYDCKTVPAAPLASLDGWVRCKAMEMLEAVYEAYKGYNYHLAYQAVFNFCNVDLSAVYGNAMKDRLYCDKPDSVLRRRAQGTMFVLYSVLCDALEPMVPLLVDEVKGYLKPMPNLHQEWSNNGPTPTHETWDTLFALRDDALLQLDRLKKENGLNKAVDAEVVWYLREPEKFATYGVDLEDVVGCGYHSVVNGNTPSLRPSPSTPPTRADRVEVKDRRNDWQACERSWKRRPDVRLCKNAVLSERDEQAVKRDTEEKWND